MADTIDRWDKVTGYVVVLQKIFCDVSGCFFWMIVSFFVIVFRLMSCVIKGNNNNSISSGID